MLQTPGVGVQCGASLLQEEMKSELVRFGDRLGGDGVIPSVASQNRNGREGEVERESARACVSVIVTSSDPPSARPRGAAGGGRGEWG